MNTVKENIKLKIVWNSISHIPGYQHLLKLCNWLDKDLDIMSVWDIEELKILSDIEKDYKERQRMYYKELKEFREIGRASCRERV